MTAGILPVFRGSKFFSNKEVGQINKNLNIEYKEVNTGSDIFGKKFEAMKEEKSGLSMRERFRTGQRVSLPFMT